MTETLHPKQTEMSSFPAKPVRKTFVEEVTNELNSSFTQVEAPRRFRSGWIAVQQGSRGGMAHPEGRL